MSDQNPLLATGSVALDTLETPFGNTEEVLGGSAAHFALGASLFHPVDLVGVVGQDFPQKYLDLFTKRSIQIDHLEQQSGRTFRWHGRYRGAMDSAETIDIQQNVFEDYVPELTNSGARAEVLFLGNSSPRYQMKILEQVENPKFIGADTMNLWIETQSQELDSLLSRIDLFFLNYEEALSLGESDNTIKAGKEILKKGPETVIIKKGEHGALLMRDEGIFSIPGVPLEVVRDPTGAGDTFASGVMGYISNCEDIDFGALKTGVILGNLLASFTVECFGTDGMQDVEQSDLENRLQYYYECISLQSDLVQDLFTLIDQGGDTLN